MSNQAKIRVWAYNLDDKKLFVYNMTEAAAQELAETFTRDIIFLMTESEEKEFNAIELPQDNLKQDFIMFKPSAIGRSAMECTCGKFIEFDYANERGMDRLAKKAVKHARKTGHQLNPRGN